MDNHSKNWLKAGGLLGFVVLLSRLLRLPLATVLTSLPFILSYLAEQEKKQPRPPSQTMTAEEARLILGVPVTASAQDIKEAHRRLMLRNHPDKGGSDYLAARINQARDILLK